MAVDTGADRPEGAAPPSQSAARRVVRRARVPSGVPAARRRARALSAELAVEFPQAPCELDFRTPLELAVATVLSAQTTDARVNLVTPALFARYPDAAAYAGADRSELEELIRSTGFYRNKAASLMGLGAALVDRFSGEVPATLEELVTLPGFGRKTANVILGHAFGLPGITVDTHVGRLVRRWGLTDAQDAVKVEAELSALVPRKDWTLFSNRTIFHGRRICHAKKPACGACPLARLCPAYGSGPTDAVQAAALVVGDEREHLLSLVGLASDEAR